MTNWRPPFLDTCSPWGAVRASPASEWPEGRHEKHWSRGARMEVQDKRKVPWFRWQREWFDGDEGDSHASSAVGSRQSTESCSKVCVWRWSLCPMELDRGLWNWMVFSRKSKCVCVRFTEAMKRVCMCLTLQSVNKPHQANRIKTQTIHWAKTISFSKNYAYCVKIFISFTIVHFILYTM